jgi:tetratricopeptide (TPR) repeat protein
MTSSRLTRWFCGSALAAVLLCPSATWAALPLGEFENANKLYEHGKFAEAAALYTNLVQSGQVSSALYFNLGNAFFKAGQMGRAIGAYRQAEQMTPRDPDLGANLRFARNQVKGPPCSPERSSVFWDG